MLSGLIKKKQNNYLSRKNCVENRLGKHHSHC